MPKKKVLFLTSWYPSKANPSLGNFVMKHAECAASVADITVLYAVSSDNVQRVEVNDQVENGIRTIRVYFPKRKANIPLLSSYSRYKAYLNALEKGFERIQHDIDLTHLNVAFPAGLFALDLYRKKDIPYLLLSHWTGYLSNTNTYENSIFFVRKLHQKIFKGAKKVLTVSDHLGSSLQKLGLTESYSIYPNVVDGEIFQVNKSDKKQNDPLRILHISSFDEEHKNISGMLEAISGLDRSYRLTMITEGPVQEAQEATRKAGISSDVVEIYSQCEASEIADAFGKSDVFVLFSNYETFSVVLAESWMCGVPAIYSKCGGLTEIDDSTLGVQIKARDVMSLKQKLQLFDPSEYDPCSIRSFATQFEKIQLSDEIRKIYDEIV